MLRTLFMCGIYFGYLGAGFAAPFIASLGYVWVDAFRPQDVSFFILNQFPVAMVMGTAAIGTYFLMDRRAPPPWNALSGMQLLMALWVTVTMTWAVAPTMGWGKWDWAFKTVLFSAFVPLVIRSRVQIEAFIQTYVLALAANFLPFGAKVILSGGGYGRNLGLVGGNSGLAEGGLLSTACLMVIPLALFLARNTQLMPRWKVTPWAYWGIAGLALACAIGTYQRSALVGLAAMALVLILRSRHKLLYLTVAAVIAGILIYAMSDRWTGRISTISGYQKDHSALVRILVWKWTLDFVRSYPLGGGFHAYVINQISIPGDAYNPAGEIQFGRAFHSIYFEVLGEHGFPGLFLFLAIAAVAMLQTFLISRRTARIPELEWCASLAVALQAGLAAFLTAGAFVGIAFQPMFWYFVAMTVSLQAYVRRVEAQAAEPRPGWRAVAQQNLSSAPAGGVAGGWRRPVSATPADTTSEPGGWRRGRTSSAGGR